MTRKKFLTRLATTFAFAALPFVTACGDDSDSASAEVFYDEPSSSSEIRSAVNSIYELGKCSSSNKYETLYVYDEYESYTCSYVNGSYKWVGEYEEENPSYYDVSSSSVKSSSSVYWSSSSSSKVKSSSSEVKFSSSEESYTYTNVSDVWTGKMEKPLTEYIEGKNYMLIYTAEELAYFADQVTNKGEEKINAKLMQHIRLNPDNMVDEKGNLLISKSSLNEWTPIGGGTNDIIFKGVFDGNGYTVSGIYVNKPAFERAGFIGTLGGTTSSDSGHVLFLGIENSYIVGGEQVGGIVGRMNYSEVQQVYNRKSYVKGTKYVGGIVGYKNHGWLYYAYNSGMIVSSEDRASGIAGYNSNASTSLIVSYNVGFLIAPNKGTTAGISTTANSSKNCFYINQSDREIVPNGAEEKTDYFMTSEEFVSTLNGLSFDNIWVLDEDEVNDGYPVFKWERTVYK